MALETVSFMFGGLLILTGMLGGGLQVRELNIPKIGTAARVACMGAGLLFVIVAISINPVSIQPRPAQLASPGATPALRPDSISFRIYDELGKDQVSEQVKVVIDGRTVGSITVSAMHRTAELLVVVPREDRYSYQLAANAVFLAEGNKLTEYVGIGEGYINAKNGMNFSLEGEISGNTWQARLVETN